MNYSVKTTFHRKNNIMSLNFFKQNGAVNLSYLAFFGILLTLMLWNMRLELRTWINEYLEIEIDPWAWKETYLEYQKLKMFHRPRPTFGLAKKTDLACLPWLSFLMLKCFVSLKRPISIRKYVCGCVVFNPLFYLTGSCITKLPYQNNVYLPDS